MNRRRAGATRFLGVFSLADRSAGATATALAVALLAANAAAWGWAWLSFGTSPLLMSTAFLAYTFGLKHAFDADHIAAIDNVTRKLIETGRPAATTGLFFSLGHSTVVVLASMAVAALTKPLEARFASLQPFASLFGTGISALCLLALAIANSLILVSVVRLFIALRRNEEPIDNHLQQALAKRGLLARVLRGVFRLVSRSWHMYPLGFLFGLGFDTATEIGVLGVSAMQATQGLPLASILVFPGLFTAGMALVDTIDAVMMAGAYRWASLEPLRKLYYNIAITFASVAVALAIGGIELLGLFAGESAADGFWRLISALNDHLSEIGVAVVTFFAACWALSLVAGRGGLPDTGSDPSQ